MIKQLRDLVSDLNFPVIICKNQEKLPVIYMNKQAGIMFSPTASVDQLKGGGKDVGLPGLLAFEAPQELDIIMSNLKTLGQVDDYPAGIKMFDGRVKPFLISGKVFTLEKNEDSIFIYVLEQEKESDGNVGRWLMGSALIGNDVEESIENVMKLAGTRANVSRVYIFEETSPTMTRNTYEWCAKGIEPAIQELQELKKEDYNYNTIVGSGMYVTDDVRTLPREDREILEMQGIRSLAILTIYDKNRPIGYVGFDDCVRYRKWRSDELAFLETVASILTILITRRNAEQRAHRSQEVLQLLSDNSDEVIYANDLEDYSIKFASKALLEALGKTADEVLGKPCWQVLHKGQTGPCDFCPIPHIRLEKGANRSEVYTWERHNDMLDKYYLLKDNIVKWVDDKYVHVETAIDISRQIRDQERLQHLASTDIMTGAYNRQWGTNILEEKLGKPETAGSLSFMDIDGFKQVNDTWGHNAGDRMLIEMVDIVRGVLPDGSMMCRWGGDEFVIWMDENATQAEAVLQQAKAEMEKRNEEGSRKYVLSFSYGIASVERGAGVSLDKVVKTADKRMYADKQKKNQLRRRWDDQ